MALGNLAKIREQNVLTQDGHEARVTEGDIK